MSVHVWRIQRHEHESLAKARGERGGRRPCAGRHKRVLRSPKLSGARAIVTAMDGVAERAAITVQQALWRGSFGGTSHEIDITYGTLVQ